MNKNTPFCTNRENERFVRHTGCGVGNYVPHGASCNIGGNEGFPPQYHTGCGSSCMPNTSISQGHKPPMQSFGLNGYPLAMVYSPVQEFRDLFDLDNGLYNGTIFKELYLPFNGGKEGGCSCAK